MAKGLQLAEPPKRRRETQAAEEAPAKPAAAKVTRKAAAKREAAASPSKFTQMRADEMVQFNKRVSKAVADGYAMMAIKTGKKVPELLAEGLEALEERYGKI